MPGSFEDRVCLVTGAAGVIGSATAQAFATAGARVSLIDGNASGAAELESALAGEHGANSVIAIAADIADATAVEAYIAETVERLGGLHSLVNCAGVEGAMADAHEYEEAEFDRVMNVNVKGTWLNIRHGVPAMLESGGGSIVNIASGAALRALPGLPAYVASKHAVLGLTRSAAVELATSGVRVNALAPGPVESPMMDSLEKGIPGLSGEEARELYLQRVPMKRYADATEIANTALFLCSDEASFLTGAMINVDGGASAS